MSEPISPFLIAAEDRAVSIMGQVYDNNMALCKKKDITLKQQFKELGENGVTYTMRSFQRWNRNSADHGNLKTVSIIVITALAAFHGIRSEILMFHDLTKQR